MNIQDITIEKLRGLSNNWNQETKDLLLFISGSGDSCGGSMQGYHICVHGKYSATPMTITIEGVYKSGYNIARGANGDNYGNVSYWKGITDLRDKKLYETPPTYKISVEGSPNVGDTALCNILSAEKEWLIR